jgi:hypothetical protein
MAMEVTMGNIITTTTRTTVVTEGISPENPMSEGTKKSQQKRTPEPLSWES